MQLALFRRRKYLRISYTDRQVTQSLSQKWRSENYKFGFRIGDF